MCFLHPGFKANGFWDLKVAEAGDHEITLRRWPEELNLPIPAALPPPNLDPERHDSEFKLYELPAGVISAVKARLQVGAVDQTVSVQPGVSRVAFRVHLLEGPVQLQTWLTDASGKSWGAYYVYVERKKAED
jgi:hypothetical protein